MNNPSNSHEPTAAFRAQLKREIARAVRSDQLFGAPPAPARRIATAFGIAAGVVLTLLTGVVLGASASYASAAEPDAARPTFAMRPITNALTAIGCGVTKTDPQAPKRARVAATVQPPMGVAVPTDTTAAQVAQRKPDRARIAALATQHQPHVVRGDTAAEYILMVFDAADKYLWSTYGSGSFSVEIGGDTRTAAERLAFMTQYRAEYQGDSLVFLSPKASQMMGGKYLHFAGDSLRNAAMRLKTKRPLDSLIRGYFDTLSVRRIRGYIAGVGAARGDSGARGTGGSARGGGRGTAIPDSLFDRQFARRAYLSRRPGDSLSMRELGYGAFLPTGVSPTNAPDGSYRIGWGNGAVTTNSATGLVAAGNGQSGIAGLPATWLSMGESYAFGPGELSPQTLRIVVVHLTPGTIWKGQ